MAMTPEAMKQTFSKIPQSLIAMESGNTSPWVSRLLTELGYKVNRGARAKGAIDHQEQSEKTIDTMRGHWHGWRESIRSCWGRCGIRSAQAQIHLTVIRARAELVRARTALVNAARGLVEVLWAAPAQVWHTAGGTGGWTTGSARGVARGSGTAAPRRSSITEPSASRNTRCGWRKSPKRTTHTSNCSNR